MLMRLSIRRAVGAGAITAAIAVAAGCSAPANPWKSLRSARCLEDARIVCVTEKDGYTRFGYIRKAVIQSKGQKGSVEDGERTCNGTLKAAIIPLVSDFVLFDVYLQSPNGKTRASRTRTPLCGLRDYFD